MQIIGAGLAGCIAATIFQNAEVFEAGPNKTNHQALLRFRSPQIGEAVGIPFEKVKVYKGIWHNDKPVELSPRYINLYSRKVSDKISARSITNLETTERWIAPSNFHEMLKQEIGDRIYYENPINDNYLKNNHNTIISTMPINILSKMLGEEIKIEKNISRIFVSKFKIPDCNIHMTYYYTDPTTPIYRSSITKDELIIESTFEIHPEDLAIVIRSFGLTGINLEKIMFNYEQSNGKLTPINEKLRRDFLFNVTRKYNIYSLGRFAAWRNLILDDVYKDCLKIKQFINRDNYHMFKELGE